MTLAVLRHQAMHEEQLVSHQYGQLVSRQSRRFYICSWPRPVFAAQFAWRAALLTATLAGHQMWLCAAGWCWGRRSPCSPCAPLGALGPAPALHTLPCRAAAWWFSWPDNTPLLGTVSQKQLVTARCNYSSPTGILIVQYIQCCWWRGEGGVNNTKQPPFSGLNTKDSQKECRKEEDRRRWRRMVAVVMRLLDLLDVVGITMHFGPPPILVHRLLVVWTGGAVLLYRQILQTGAGGQGVPWPMCGGHGLTVLLPGGLVECSVGSGGCLALASLLVVDSSVRSRSRGSGRADGTLGNGSLVAVHRGTFHAFSSEAWARPGACSWLWRLGLTLPHLLLMLSHQFLKSALTFYLFFLLFLFFQRLLAILFLDSLAGRDALHTAQGCLGGHWVLGSRGPWVRVWPVQRWWVYLHPTISHGDEDISRIPSWAWVTRWQGGVKHLLCSGRHLVRPVIFAHDHLCGPLNLGLVLCLGKNEAMNIYTWQI